MLALLGSAVIAKLITELFSKYDSKGLKELEEIMRSSRNHSDVITNYFYSSGSDKT